MKGRALATALIFVAIISVPAFSGCGKKEAARENIRVPVALPLSGQLATYGEAVKNGAILKAEEVNAGGGIDGRMIEIVLEDDLCDPREAAEVAKRLASDPGVSIVVGHVCSSATMAALPIYKNARLPTISPASTNPEIGRMSPYCFRNVYKDDFQGTFLARYVSKVKGWDSVAIFYENNDYSLILKEAFAAEAKNQKIKIVQEEAYTSDSTDFVPQLKKLKALNPDAVFIPGYPPQATIIISQAAGLGLETGFFGADGLDDSIMLENPDAEGLIVTTPFLLDKAVPEARSFVQAYTARYGTEPNWFAANTYDAVGLAVEAIKSAGQDREKIRAYLSGITTPDRAYLGVTGETYFDSSGDCLKPAFIKTIRGGRWVKAERQLK